jgi:hypothetical protein
MAYNVSGDLKRNALLITDLNIPVVLLSSYDTHEHLMIHPACFNPLNSSDYCMYLFPPVALKLKKFYVLPPQCLYVFYVILGTW